MKKLLAILLMLCLLCGCAANQTQATTASVPVPSTQTDAAESSEPPSDPLAVIRDWVSQGHSFEHIGKHSVLGGSYTTEHVQLLAKDGSFSFFSQWTTKYHTTDTEVVETVEYYYQYEGETLVCYMRTDNNAPQRFAMPKEEVQVLISQRNYVSGTQEVLPAYLEDFAEDTEHTDPTTRRFTYKIPFSKALSEETMLALFLSDEFTLRNKQLDATLNANLLCSIVCDRETLCPVSFECDFEELKPHLLSSGDISMEFALQTDLMQFSYTYSFELADTIPVPQEFVP